MTLLILCLFLISHSTFKPSYTTYDGFYYDHIYKNNLNFFRERFVQSTFLHFETHVTFIFLHILFFHYNTGLFSEVILKLIKVKSYI